ncbi:hypothetical protein GCM10010455_10570 [Microbacterium esteraromaticum]|uniref:response regulator transcription factor n=1 Tax=Microbacterium esteraromaticum TaxID=57043 RepID=UPI001956273A|nr:response regulator transcription factor [Microbacterium esteraromaticum]MBM7464666.1 DNA-binding NarL/FixJ family response regulator [Microbacterium esteraromaticum]
MREPKRYRAAIVEPHVLQRLRAVELLRDGAGMDVVHSCASVSELITWVRRHSRTVWPHVVLTELLPRSENSRDLESVMALRHAGMRIVLVSSLHQRGAARRLVDAGFDGVVSKLDTEETLLSTIAAVVDGEHPVTELARQAVDRAPSVPKLSAQEEKVFVLYVAGHSISAVADAIGVQAGTARKYLNRVKQKYKKHGIDVSTKVDLAKVAWDEGLLD